jgi:hypothetical protein
VAANAPNVRCANRAWGTPSLADREVLEVAVSRVVADMSMSFDGFIAGPNEDVSGWMGRW